MDKNESIPSVVTEAVAPVAAPCMGQAATLADRLPEKGGDSLPVAEDPEEPLEMTEDVACEEEGEDDVELTSRMKLNFILLLNLGLSR